MENENIDKLLKRDSSDSRTIRQKESVQKWIKNRCKGTVVATTGFGKTTVGLEIVLRFRDKNPQSRITVVVPTDALKKQWEKKLYEIGIFFFYEVLVINSAIMRSRIDTDLLIVDEIHRMASPTFQKLFEICKPPMILGLTATFERLDGKETLIQKYCPVVDSVPNKDARTQGWVADYKEYKVILDVPDINVYKEYNKVFLQHFSYFNFDFNTAMNCVKSKLARDKYAKMMCNGNPALLKEASKECSAHAFQFMRMLQARKLFIQNHPKKLEIAKLILKHRPNAKAITFNANIEQCEKYGFGYIVHSGKTKKKNRLTLEEFNDLDSGVIHSSKMLNEGVDLKGVNLAIILYNTSSNTERIQRIGRAIRKEGSKVAEVFSIIINETVEMNWDKKSSKGLSSITINEDQLLDVLEHRDLDLQERETAQQQFLFTF